MAIGHVLGFAALLGLLGASAFFNLSETALIGVRRWDVKRLAEQGSHRAQMVDAMLDAPERVLSTVLVGNTIATITAAAVATVLAQSLFHAWATTIATFSVTVVVLIACELVPKTIAVQNPLPHSLRIAYPLRVVESVLKPVITLAERVSAAVVRPFGIKSSSKAPYITADEIEMLVRFGVEQGEVKKFEQRVISDLFDFKDTPVRQIMTPADKVTFVDAGATLKDAVEAATHTGRTRLPIAEGNFDHVLGFVHVKDLLKFSDEQSATLPVRAVLRGCMTIPADMPADRVLQQMQREHRMLAVVQDGGHNVGMVTADDLVEELVGELHDEFDQVRRFQERAAQLREGERGP